VLVVMLGVAGGRKHRTAKHNFRAMARLSNT